MGLSKRIESQKQTIQTCVTHYELFSLKASASSSEVPGETEKTGEPWVSLLEQKRRQNKAKLTSNHLHNMHLPEFGVSAYQNFVILSCKMFMDTH